MLLAWFLVVVDRANPTVDGQRLSVWFERALAQKDPLVPRDKAEPFRRLGRRGAEWLAREMHQQPSLRIRAQQFIVRNSYRSQFLRQRFARWLRTLSVAPPSRGPRIQLASQLLGHLDPAVAAPVLARRFKSCREADRGIVAEALGGLGPDAAESAGPCLVSMLATTNSADLAAVILALGEVLYRPDDVVPMLVPFLTNADTLVRTEASYTLGTYKPAPAVTLKPLIDCLADSHGVVKANAARALGRMGPDARPAVDALVAASRAVGGNAPIVPRALEALSSITPEALPITTEELRDWVASKIPNDLYFRVMAETAMVRLDFPEATLTSDCLRLVKFPKPYNRWEALERLGECGAGNPEVCAALAAGLSDPNGLVRHTARRALDQWTRRHQPAAPQ